MCVLHIASGFNPRYMQKGIVPRRVTRKLVARKIFTQRISCGSYDTPRVEAETNRDFQMGNRYMQRAHSGFWMALLHKSVKEDAVLSELSFCLSFFPGLSLSLRPGLCYYGPSDH